MIMKSMILTFIIYCLACGLASADYYDQLKVIEKQRLNDLAGTENLLRDISKYKEDFSNKETHLYLLLKAHSETMHSNFPEAEKLLLNIIDSEASFDYKGRAHSILAAVLQLQGKYVRS